MDRANIELPDPEPITDEVREELLRQSREWREAFRKHTAGMITQVTGAWGV